jgi:probable rRNA maturation factor
MTSTPKPAPAKVSIEFVVADTNWRVTGLRPALRRAAARALAHEGAVGDVTILLSDDAALRRLNRDFREKDRPTNVLSFPAVDNPEGHLGDLALAFGVTAAEAEAGGKSFADHASHLVVHGVLHLLGYDHETDAQAGIMEPLETEILAGLGIADPYAPTMCKHGPRRR